MWGAKKAEPRQTDLGMGGGLRDEQADPHKTAALPKITSGSAAFFMTEKDAYRGLSPKKSKRDAERGFPQRSTGEAKTTVYSLRPAEPDLPAYLTLTASKTINLRESNKRNSATAQIIERGPLMFRLPLLAVLVFGLLNTIACTEKKTPLR